MGVHQSKYSKCLYFSANTLARKTEKLANIFWSKIGLSPSLGYMLILINETPGIHPSLLCEQLQLTPSTITRLIEKLEKLELVYRTNTGKNTLVFSSEKGLSLHPKLYETIGQFTHACADVLNTEEGNALIQAMNAMSEKLG